MAFDSLLVANRGEIACRILRTARGLGLRTVAVYSEADRDSPHVGLADEAVLIGPAPVSESYLLPDAILKAARSTGVGAIHPGYGFLSENDVFAELVLKAGLVFVGPPARAIRLMGNKAEAKRLMLAAGVPCVPGYQGEAQDDATLATEAGQIGYPLMVKAAAGGGGRGMRLVTSETELPQALALARSEAGNAFGSDTLILEKAVLHARHVEIQIFADQQGNCIHLGERDCSLQRRHQKVIEEAPCPALTPEQRDAMGASAVAAAKAVDYCGAGTVEFLLDQSGDYYFLEMNTRLQVEHPVTEMVTGFDLVAMQIAVARGEPLSLGQSAVHLAGHAIEARLYAEDPANGYLPATGRIELWRPPDGSGIRVDCGVTTGQEITPYYDPMLAKVIAWGETREVARQRLLRAIEETVLLGPVTNGPFLAELLRNETFVSGKATTDFIDGTFPDGLGMVKPGTETAALAAALILDAELQSAYATSGLVSPSLLGWSSASLPPIPMTLTCDDRVFDLSALASGPVWRIGDAEDHFDIEIGQVDQSSFEVRINGRKRQLDAAFDDHGALLLSIGGHSFTFHRAGVGSEMQTDLSGGVVRSPMPGVVIEVLVSEGQPVDPGDALVVVEAMKMQHRIPAPVGGAVRLVPISAGDRLASGDVLIEIESGETG